MMSTTTILISTHGNELGNALWLPDHSLVIEAQSFGRKGNLYFPVTFARGNESHPIYYRNISCYKSYDSNDKNSCRADSSTSLDQNFNLDVQELAEIIHSYVDYHKKMFLLGKESWEKLEIETNNYPLLLS